MTQHSPAKLLSRISEIEKNLGRNRSEKKFSDRTIDIDILFYNDIILETKKLIIPHPYLHHRKFVLIPLIEIEPKYFHPKNKKSLSKLFNECKDNCEVKLY